MRDVLGLTEGELTLWPATLYGALEELREQGRIRETAQPANESDEQKRKRWFRITSAGRRALETEIARLETTLRAATRRLAGSSR